jgi:type II secretory pathway component PulJ
MIKVRGYGFTLVEVLIALSLSMLIISVLLQVFLANQRTMKLQIDISTLIYRTRRITDILRADIHRAHGKVRVIDGKELLVVSRLYLIEGNSLVMIDENHRKKRLIERVSDMNIIKSSSVIDITVHIAAGSLGKTIHVLASLR